MRPLDTVALVLVVIGLLGNSSRPQPDAPPSTPHTPTAAMQQIVEPIRVKLSGHKEKAAVLAALYRDWADRLEADQGQIVTSTGIFQAAHGRVLDFRLEKTPYRGEPSVGAEIDAAIEKALGGRDQVQLTDEARRKLIEVLRAISWACGG